MQDQSRAATKSLRPYQLKAFQHVTQRLAGGAKSILVVAPPGAGKTIIALHLADHALQQGQRVIFMAHRRELITQTSRVFDAAGIDHGVVMAGHPRCKPELPMQIGTIQTLSRQVGALHPADIVMVDEAHRTAAASYMSVLDKAYAKARYLGFTGTPWRLDSRPLNCAYEEQHQVVTTQNLIDMGFLVDPVVFAPEKRVDLSRVRVGVDGDYRASELDAMMNTDVLCGDIVEHWIKHAKGTSTIAFAVSQSHSQRIAAQFNIAGISAEHVDCMTPQVERDAILSKLRSGEVSVVSNVDILTEGFDLPRLGTVILARPTRSVVRYLQAIGRVMRPAPGKEKALCLDHAGSVHEHGFPTDPRGVSLDGPGDEKRISRVATEPCPKCGAVIRVTQKTCAACGWVRPLPDDEEEQEPSGRREGSYDGELVPVDRDARPRCTFCGSFRIQRFAAGKYAELIKCRDVTCLKHKTQPIAGASATASDEGKANEYQRLVGLAQRKGWNDGWPRSAFKRTFGHYPLLEAV
jgi:DNA repair protein RadD